MAGSDGNGGNYWYRYLLRAGLDASSRVPREFTQLKSGEPQLKYLFKLLPKSGASFDEIPEKLKNNEKAQEYRNSGNDLFSWSNDGVKVAELYTQSIAHALPGSRELALAYANRSAVLYRTGDYEDCLVDIERSLDNDYPDEMKAKLYARRVRCLVKLKKPQTEVEKALEDTREALLKMDIEASGRDLVEKTLTDKNHMAPTASKSEIKRVKPALIQDDSCDIRGATGITIRYSKKYGRHIVATRDIRPTEIIGVIDTYAISQNAEKRYRECAHCGLQTISGIPCYHCVHVIYCSTSCRDRAWNDYHEFECPILGIILSLEFFQLATISTKMTLKALREAGSVIELQKMLQRIDSVSDPRVKGFTGNVFDCTKYASVYTLATHAGKIPSDVSYMISVTSLFTVYQLATRTEAFGQKYNSGLQVFEQNPLLYFLGGLMIKNYNIVLTNGTGLPNMNGGGKQRIAPFTALCNHSCDSNVTSLAGPKSIVYALQPIKAGDQIWDNYGGYHFSSFPKAERQQMLNTNFHFTCDCVACTNDWPMLDQLPSAFEIPSLSPTIRTRLSELQKTFLNKHHLNMKSGDTLAAKNELIQFLELLYKHARPCKEMIAYRQVVQEMYGFGIDAS